MTVERMITQHSSYTGYPPQQPSIFNGYQTQHSSCANPLVNSSQNGRSTFGIQELLSLGQQLTPDRQTTTQEYHQQHATGNSMNLIQQQQQVYQPQLNIGHQPRNNHMVSSPSGKI